MPPHNEVILSGGQLKSRELRRIIHKAYHGDESMAMLTQVNFYGDVTFIKMKAQVIEFHLIAMYSNSYSMFL